ncbi:MAG: stage V sporulation protein AD [Lachnospira sp.]|nr:stage V sporulation protein AD [Lachnospira sp.]
MIKGKQSVVFDKPVYIEAVASIVGEKEGQGPYGKYFDIVSNDPMMNTNTWEEAESKLQELAVDKLFDKSGIGKDDVRYMFGGDLLGQLIATSFGLKKYEIPLFGLYGACSTFGEGLSLAAMCVSGGYAESVIALASSHFASAEKQFRFPLEYGNQRPMASTWTVTGCGAAMVTERKTDVRISGITTGTIVDYGVKDSMNMGACMAPAAAALIAANLADMDVDESYYDKIITGDLGTVGQKILIDLLREKGYEITNRHMDCGIEIFDGESQNTMAGGSGCGCSATMFCGSLIDRIRSGEWNRILFVPTGALLSTVSYNEGKSVPGIAHGVVIERGV